MRKEEENVFFSFVIFPSIYNERAAAAAVRGGREDAERRPPDPGARRGRCSSPACSRAACGPTARPGARASGRARGRSPPALSRASEDPAVAGLCGAGADRPARSSQEAGADSSGVPGRADCARKLCAVSRSLSPLGKLDSSSAGPVPGRDHVLGAMEFTASPKPQLSSRANAFSIAALMSSGGSKEKQAAENTIKPLGKSACAAVRPSVPWLREARAAASDPQARGHTSRVGGDFPFRPKFSLGTPQSVKYNWFRILYMC